MQSFILAPDGSRIFVTTPDAVDIYDAASSNKVINTCMVLVVRRCADTHGKKDKLDAMHTQ